MKQAKTFYNADRLDCARLFGGDATLAFDSQCVIMFRYWQRMPCN